MKKNLLNIVTAVALIYVFPGSAVAEVNPKLGSTANFVLFSSMGAVSNVGVSNLTGYIGTNGGGTSTGFETAIGTHSFHNGDAASQQAAADLLVMYNQINAATGTVLPSSSLGAGQILTPGVYTRGEASSLTGQLILDGQGDARAEFIIKIGGAFSTLAYSEVVLLNGANPCNIYWLVEGAISMATHTKMKGTVIANNGAIELLFENVQLEGRVLTTNGAISVTNSLAFIPDCSYILSSVNYKVVSTYATFFPNPMNGSVIITLADASSDNRSQLKIYNALGKAVINQTITNTSTTVKTNLPTGVYFYKLTGKDNKIQTGKLMSK